MLKITLTAVLCFILGFFAHDFEVPRFFQIKPVSRINKVKSELRSVALTVITDATSGGKLRYPMTLDDFSNITIPVELAAYRDPESGNRYDWLYFGRNISHSQSPSIFILVATPTLFNKEGYYPKLGEDQYRLVAYADGNVEMLLEQSFKQRIEAQLSN